MKCTFIGHRDVVEMENRIYAEIKKLINLGITEFISGGVGNFDKLCENAVKKLGGKIIFVPYNVKQIKEKDRLFYDEIICPLGNKEYSKFDIPNRNKWLVDNSDICLCYVRKAGGAKHTLDYAIKRNKRIINLYPYDFNPSLTIEHRI